MIYQNHTNYKKFKVYIYETYLSILKV